MDHQFKKSVVKYGTVYSVADTQENNAVLVPAPRFF